MKPRGQLAGVVAVLPRLLLGMLLVLSSFALSEGATQPDSRARGRQIVTKGSKEGAPPCAACHAENGASDGSGAFPRLTGQFAPYLKKQLEDFASGARPNPVMSPIAKRLSDQEKGDVAAYFAAQQAPFFPPHVVEQPVLELGGALAATGRPSEGIPACFSCHGQSGKGTPPDFPYLAGQYWSYLAAQLRDFRTGLRHNDAGGVMRLIASKLRTGEAQAVSAYFSSVRPPCSCAELPADSAATK